MGLVIRKEKGWEKKRDAKDRGILNELNIYLQQKIEIPKRKQRKEEFIIRNEKARFK